MFRGSIKNIFSLQKEIAPSQLLKIDSTKWLAHQTRNTAILKRRFPVHLAKMDSELRDRRLRNRHYIYDMVVETNREPKTPLKVLLIKPVEGLGLPGDVVEVDPTRGRVQLLLPRLAVYASLENIEKYASVSQHGYDIPSSPFVYKTVNLLEADVFSVTMNLETPWEVLPWHVRLGFRKGRVHVPEEAITLPDQPISGPDLAIEGREFLVRVKINNKETARTRFRVHHVASEPMNRLPWVDKHWLKAAKPIFEEEAEELADLNMKDAKLLKEEDFEEE